MRPHSLSLAALLTSTTLLALTTPILGLASTVSPSYLLLADQGAPVHQTPTWETSLRRLSLSAPPTSTILQTFPFRLSVLYRAGAYALARDARTNHIYTATYEEVYRTELDGTKRVRLNATHVSYFQVLVVAGGVLYAGDCGGFIQRLDLSDVGEDGGGDGVMEKWIDVRPDRRDVREGWETCVRGLAVDEVEGWVYWSVVTAPKYVQVTRPDYGSIRRARLRNSRVEEEEVLIPYIFSPGQIRLSKHGGYLYWTERGFRSFPTALRRARLASTDNSSSSSLSVETVFDSRQSSLLTIGNATVNRTAPISSFAMDERGGRLWFVGDDYEVPRIVEAGLDGAEPRVVNRNVTEIGYPEGLEFVEDGGEGR